MEALEKAGAMLYVWDDKEEAREHITPDSKIMLEEPRTYPWDQIEMLVLSPGVPYTHPEPHPVVHMAKLAGCEVICDVELLYRMAPKATYIGITGTNGKSTTTALIGHICQQAGLHVAIGGNIGTSAISLPKFSENGVYVLEMSSYQLDLLKEITFDIAVLLNITPDHIDRHGSMEGYINAKRHIFDRQTSDDAAVIAVDQEVTESIAGELETSEMVKVYRVSGSHKVEKGLQVKEGTVIDSIFSDITKQLLLSETKRLPGQHNQQNMAAAYVAAHLLGIEGEAIIEAIQSFAGLPHRLQYIKNIQGVTFVNDSKATNDIAAAQALSSYNNIHWIVGGVPKEGGIDSLKPYFSHVKHAYLMGEAQKAFATALQGQLDYTECDTLEKAFANATDKAQEGDVVLLSPACASFDQFANFEARGDVFIKLVGALAEKIGEKLAS